MTDERTSTIVKRISQDPGLPCATPTLSFWQEPVHPALSTIQSDKLPSQNDVLVIGSGITAASIADYILKNDPRKTVTIVEARTLTSGATGRNNGHILEVPYEEFDLEVSLLGLEAAKKMARFRLAHLDDLMQYARTELSAEAQAKSEIRKVEVVDAIFDSKLWEETKGSLARFQAALPKEGQEWKAWEGEEVKVSILQRVILKTAAFVTSLY